MRFEVCYDDSQEKRFPDRWVKKNSTLQLDLIFKLLLLYI